MNTDLAMARAAVAAKFMAEAVDALERVDRLQAELDAERLENCRLRRIDPTCPLRDTPGHVCANRDGRARVDAGQPALRPGSTCRQGARYQMTAESEACAAAVHLGRKVRDLLAVLHEYGLTHGDAECEISEATDAVFMFEMLGTIASFHKVQP